MLTISELKQIKHYLEIYSKKDSQLPTVETVNNVDYLAIVQGGNNVTIQIELLKRAVLEGIITDEEFNDLWDETPTKDSSNPVRSSGIWHAINDANVIGTSQIKDDAIETSKIKDNNVTYNKLSDALHKQIEKYTSSISVSSNSLRINGTILTTTLTKTDKIVSFGDAGESTTTPDSSNTTANDGTIDGNTWTLPNTVGTYTVTYKATKNGTARISTANVSVYLRKYFGFSASTPADITALGAYHDSPAVNCTITIPVDGIGFKYIYFAVPSNMTISSIIQPDSLNAPLAFTQLSNVTTTIGGQVYTYKLYRSVDTIDSAVPKRLTIS